MTRKQKQTNRELREVCRVCGMFNTAGLLLVLAVFVILCLFKAPASGGWIALAHLSGFALGVQAVLFAARVRAYVRERGACHAAEGKNVGGYGRSGGMAGQSGG